MNPSSISSITLQQIPVQNHGSQRSQQVPSGIQDLRGTGIIDLQKKSQMQLTFKSGVDELTNGNFQKAIQKFNKCIDNHSNILESMKLRSQAYFLNHQFDKAEKSYQQLIDKYPNEAAGYYGKAFALTTKGSYKGTDQMYKKAQQLDQKNYKIYFLRGYSTLKTRDYEKCLSLLMTSVVKNEKFNDPLTYIAVAQVFCHRRNFQGCRQHINYANNAIKDKSNHNYLYKFQVQQIQQELQKYNEIVEKLKQAQLNKKLDKIRRQQNQFALTRALNKSLVMNNKSIFTTEVTKIEEMLNKNNDQLSTNQTDKEIIYENNETVCNCRQNCCVF